DVGAARARGTGEVVDEGDVAASGDRNGGGPPDVDGGTSCIGNRHAGRHVSGGVTRHICDAVAGEDDRDGIRVVEFDGDEAVDVLISGGDGGGVSRGAVLCS